MRKLFLSIGCAALLGMGFVAFSCKDDDDDKSDYDKGKDNGKAYCDCVGKLSDDDMTGIMTCLEKINSASTSADYQKGVQEGMASCSGFDDEDEE